MKKYTSVTILFNPKKEDAFELQQQVEAALESRFPSFEADGGGMCIGGNERDIFFDINYGSLKKVVPHLKKKGFKCL